MKKTLKKVKEKNSGFIAEFKTFIARGNVIDMATGVIVAGAFTKIVNALTNGIIMPFVNWLVSLVTGGEKVLLATVLNGEPLYVAGEDGIAVINEKAVYINWSDFIEAIFNFLLIAFIIFMLLKIINGIHKKLEETGEAIKKKVDAKVDAALAEDEADEEKAAEEKTEEKTDEK